MAVFWILGIFLCLHTISAQTYNYAEVLHKSILFYESQRSGRLPANNRIPWRGDSAMDDMGHYFEDLAGGWYDAGDGMKFGFPMASATTLLAWSVVEYYEAYRRAGELDNIMDCIKWPLDYFIKCHVDDHVFYGQVGLSTLDHAYWGRHEDMTMERPSYVLDRTLPGSDLAGETAAAMAAASIAFRVYQFPDSTYADTLLEHARLLYEFATLYPGNYSDSIPDGGKNYNSHAGFDDEMGWAAAWLYRAGAGDGYLDLAEAWLERFTWAPWAFSWADKTAGAHLLMYIVQNGSSKYQQRTENFLNSWLPGGSVPYTPRGLAWRSAWGALRYSANVAFLAVMAADLGMRPTEYRNFARSQIHYMLGDSGRSLVTGFGTNPPVRAHHRASSCPYPPAPCNWDNFNTPDPNPQTLYGALVGGPDQNDFYVDNRTDYAKNEVSCDYNAGFTGAVAGLLQLSSH